MPIFAAVKNLRVHTAHHTHHGSHHGHHIVH